MKKTLVKIIYPSFSFDRVGDVLKASEVYCIGVKVRNADLPRPRTWLPDDYVWFYFWGEVIKCD